jgi:hypothetical protein
MQKLDPAGGFTITHPLASQGSCGLLSVTDETEWRQPGRDGKSHQQESFEDYSDHDLIVYSAEVGMIHAMSTGA